MKVRHMPTAIRHDPGFVIRHGRQMLAHTFRGTTWRSLLGLESARRRFAATSRSVHVSASIWSGPTRCARQSGPAMSC